MFAWVKEYLRLTVALRGKGRKVKDLQKTIPDKYDLVCHVKNNHHAESHDGAMVLMGEKTELHHKRKTRRKHAPVGKVNRVRRSHCIVIDPNKTGSGAVDQCEKYSTQNGPCRKFWCPCRVANKRYWIAQLALSKAQKEYNELLGQRKALVHDAFHRKERG